MAAPDATAAYRFAGFWWRVLAFVIDNFILMIGGGIAGAILGIALVGIGADKAAIQPIVSFLAIIWSWLYFALFENSQLRATLGKKACGLLVTNEHGERISFGRATGRYFAKIISGLIIGIGFMMAGWTRRKQALHDLICDTLVVRKIDSQTRVPLPDTT
jgi:uncharacterized RDD family membrane protein YckC